MEILYNRGVSKGPGQGRVYSKQGGDFLVPLYPTLSVHPPPPAGVALSLARDSDPWPGRVPHLSGPLSVFSLKVFCSLG